MSAAEPPRDVIFSSEHHTWLVEPWKAGPSAVKVVQIDDPECVVMILRDQTEVLRLTEILLAVSFGAEVSR